jgi:hypothetical protein
MSHLSETALRLVKGLARGGALDRTFRPSGFTSPGLLHDPSEPPDVKLGES